MRRPLDAPIAPAALPADVRLVPFDITTARPCRDLMNRIYAEGFGDIRDFDEWWSWVTSDADYDPRFMFVAARGDDIVGLCHCWTGAFIKDVVVDRSLRGRGLGAALVTLALLACKQIDAPFVDLKTDVDNTKAQSLYRRLGFEIVERIG
jgi:ribosomal protein S18 acetylase RimI-like enzyme